jgi:hypothetical protein
MSVKDFSPQISNEDLRKAIHNLAFEQELIVAIRDHEGYTIYKPHTFYVGYRPEEQKQYKPVKRLPIDGYNQTKIYMYNEEKYLSKKIPFYVFRVPYRGSVYDYYKFLRDYFENNKKGNLIEKDKKSSKQQMANEKTPICFDTNSSCLKTEFGKCEIPREGKGKSMEYSLEYYICQEFFCNPREKQMSWDKIFGKIFGEDELAVDGFTNEKQKRSIFDAMKRINEKAMENFGIDIFCRRKASIERINPIYFE